MSRSVIETILGAVVLITAAVFLLFSYKTAKVDTGDGYQISADFSATGGLMVGDDVQVSGVTVGTVSDIELMTDTYLARVYMSIGDDYKLPVDTAALITSEGLMGGKYMTLEPGAEEDMIEPGGHVQFTQAPQNLEQLLGQFIFSMQDTKEN